MKTLIAAGEPQENFEWRYLPRGEVRHAFEPESVGVRTRCGIADHPVTYWMGTGSQREYDICARLPRCKNCLHWWR